MKTMLVAAAVLTLGVGAAFAQGKPPGSDPGVAPQAFPNEPYHNGTVFSEIFHDVFGHSDSNAAVANQAQQPRAAQSNGG